MRRFFCTCLAVALLLSQPACPGISEFMKAYGYTELRPPSTLLAPGAMVAVMSRRPLQVKILCGPRSSLGSHWSPVQSLTHSSEFKRARKKSFDIDADVLSQVKANVEFQAISNITMKFSDAKIVELSDVDIFENIHNRSQECRDAIAARRAAGFEVSMISSGLMGDVTYVVDFDDSFKMSAQAKITALQNLAIHLGGGSSMVGSNSIHSKGLTWGIKDDMYLADLSMPNVNRNNVRPGTTILDPQAVEEAVAQVDSDPDATVVPPAMPLTPGCVDNDTCPYGELVPVPNAYPGQPTRPALPPKASRKARPQTMFDTVERGRKHVFGED